MGVKEMSTVGNYYNYSLFLSLAAYGENLAPNASNDTSLKNAGFTQSQYNRFVADGWEVVSQAGALYGDSGFSAALFHNLQTGEYVFANRGTAGAQDLFTDAWCIATLGIAGAQVIDMYRFYKQLITPAGQIVTYTADEIEKLHGIGAFYSPICFATVGMVQSYVKNDVRLGKLPNFLTDAELALTGDAGGQVVDLINWWFKITTTARREGVFACSA
jgi:hypothetical protein